MKPRLSRSFFEGPTLTVARDLLGQRLVKIEPDGERLAGIICETEAYVGTDDDGCHAKSGRTARNQSMWGRAGVCYVYFTYGMHWMLNLVTEQDGFPAAVLLRCVHPIEGINRIQERRTGQPRHHWTDGPAKLCQAFGINGKHDGLDICIPESEIYVESADRIDDRCVTVGPRVGLNRVAEPWKSMPWRFLITSDTLIERGGDNDVIKR